MITAKIAGLWGALLLEIVDQGINPFWSPGHCYSNYGSQRWKSRRLLRKGGVKHGAREQFWYTVSFPIKSTIRKHQKPCEFWQPTRVTKIGVPKKHMSDRPGRTSPRLIAHLGCLGIGMPSEDDTCPTSDMHDQICLKCIVGQTFFWWFEIKECCLVLLFFFFMIFYYASEFWVQSAQAWLFNLFAHRSAHVERVRCSPNWLPGTQLKRLPMIGMTNHQGPAK